MRVAAQSVLQQQEDPELALQLAIESALLHPGVESNSALLQAIELAHESRRLQAHSGPVGHLSFSHDADRLVTAVQMKPAKLQGPPEPAIVWDPATGKQLGKLNGPRTITSAAFSPNDDVVLTASVNGLVTPIFAKVDAASVAEATLWDARRFESQVTFAGSRLRSAQGSAFHPEAEKIVLPATGNDAVVYGFDGQQLQTLAGHQQPVIHASYSGNGRRILTCSSDGQVRVWDTGSGEELAVIQLMPPKLAMNPVLGLKRVDISHNGQFVLVLAGPKHTCLWDLADRDSPVQRTFTDCHNATFVGHGNEVITFRRHSLGGYGGLSKLPVHDPAQREWINASPGGEQLAIGSDGRIALLTSSSENREAQLWDIEKRSLRRIFSHGERISSLCVSPGSRWVVAGGVKGDVSVWASSPVKDQFALNHDSNRGSSFISTHRQGSQLGLISNLGQSFYLRLDGDSLADRQQLLGDVFARDPNHLLERIENELSLIPLSEGRIKRSKVDSRAKVLAIGPDGKLVALKQGDQRIMVWDSESDTRRFLDFEELGDAWAGFSADKDQLLVALGSGVIQLRDLQNATIAKQVGLSGTLQKFRAASDRSRFAVQLATGDVHVMDAQTLELITEVPAAGKTTREFWFSPGGNHLIISQSGGEGLVEVWDLMTKQRLTQRPAPMVAAVAHHPQQPELLIGSLIDGAVLWNYLTDEVQAITSQPQRAVCYSVKGDQFFLGSICPSEASTGFAELPEMIRRRITQPNATQISRWDRAKLKQDLSRSFPGLILTGRMQAASDGSLLVSMASNGMVLSDANQLSTQQRCQGHAQEITAALFDRQAQSLVTTGRDGRVCRWDGQSGRLLHAWHHAQSIRCAALNSDGSLLAGGDDAGVVTAWQIQKDGMQEPQPRELTLFEAPVRRVELSQDGSHVLAIDDAGTWQLIELATGNRADLSDIADKLQWAEFSADGKKLLVLTQDRDAVFLLEVDTAFGNSTPSFQEVHQGKTIIDAQFDATGQRIAILQQKQLKREDRNNEDKNFMTVWCKGLAGQTIFEEDSFKAGTRSSVQFDASGQFLIVAGAKDYSVLRAETGELWLEGEGRLYRLDRVHEAEPVVQGKLNWLIQRNSREKTATLVPLDPLAFAKTIAIPGLSDKDKKRFLIGEYSVARQSQGDRDQVPNEKEPLDDESTGLDR